MRYLRVALPLALLAAAGCDDTTRMALGEVNSIIVVADDSLWAEVQDTVLTTLQPRIFAVRDEETFQLTHASPMDPRLADLRRFRQLLVIGRPDDPWVRPALDRARDDVGEPPAIVEADNVWARSQRVTALVVPEASAADAVRGHVDRLASLFDRRYRTWARSRMYTSGHNEALTDTLQRAGGFALDMPNVYRWRQVGDSAFLFINDQPDASRLVRSLLVTWRDRPDRAPSVETALAWRDSVATRYYDWGQFTDRDRIETRTIDQDRGGLELRGVWAGTIEDFPQAGPFIARVVDCPERRFLLDAWLYAPGRSKYQYMIQLETLLASFECGSLRPQ